MLAGSALALVLVSSPVMARDHHKEDQKKESLYPNATRQAPKLDLHKKKDQEALNKGLNAVNAGQADQAKQLLGPLADGSATKSKYAQALALQGLANLKYNKQDLPGAIADLKKALDIGVMPNDTYFQLKYELAQFYVANQQYKEALQTLQEWRQQGKRETADSYALEGNIDYRLEKYPEAIAAIKKAQSMSKNPKDSWNQILMASYAESGQNGQATQMAEQMLKKNPNDATTLRNAISLLVQAQKYPEALKLMEQARNNGTLKDQKDYINMAKLYLVIGQGSDNSKNYASKATGVLEEGMQKGIVKPSYDVYKLEGDAAYIGDQQSKAIAAYKKAANMAASGQGDASLRLGQLLINDNKYSAGRDAIKAAIAKGVKHEGTAYMLLAEAERGLKNKPAAVAAMKQAAKDPETHAKAEAWLKKSGH
ncbi:tetratricopeptide repeat protein [Oleiagrimonas sp. C23AA]|nr:tetratricopeptide repeat protein [Oleiagrimonas sp. C23AA]